MSNLIVFTALLLLVLAGSILLQIYLSKKESRWFGLILPFICFSYSLLMIFNIALFEGMKGTEVFGLIASTLFLSNIPTIILLAIYLGCREKIKRRKDLEKMNIQDLE